MNTKIKGEAIKDGSVSLSALSSAVRNKIENAGGGADWNAQKGEAGYIENRTHHLNDIFGTLYENNSKVIGNYYYYYDQIYVQDSNTIFKVNINYNEDVVFNNYGTALRFSKENNKLAVTLIDNSNIFKNKGLIIVGQINKINEYYLPDTVLKTTPQELSDDDKNQALANLGIDPVVWKYMCNPFVIPNTIPGGYELPPELNQIIWDDSLDRPSAIMYNVLYRTIDGIPRPLSDWDIKYISEGDTGNASLTFNINDDYIFEIDVYGTVTEL